MSFNTIKIKGLVKLIKPNQYVGISDWEGQFLFISWKDIIRSYPALHTLSQWQEAYFILQGTAKLNWKDDNPQYFNAYEFREKTIPAPMPIPLDFLSTQPVLPIQPQQPQQPQQNVHYGQQLPSIQIKPQQSQIQVQSPNISNQIKNTDDILRDIYEMVSNIHIILINIKDFLVKDYKPEYTDGTKADNDKKLPQVIF